MKKRNAFLLIVCMMSVLSFAKDGMQTGVKMDTITLYDKERERQVPIAIYRSTDEKMENKVPVVISHGYGQNKGGDYLRYSFLANALAAKGYFVVSIQHELKTDPLMPVTGKPQIVRKPFWEAGVRNIRFVLSEMEKRYGDLDFKELVLIGHSNGGDTSLLFAQNYPDAARKIISLDNRRMAFPRNAKPRIFSIRSKDFPADEGVLPTQSEKKKYGMVVDPSDIGHDRMSDHGGENERQYLITKILGYLQDRHGM